jgi:outer membrane receptor for ferrienterochelin and colicins
MRRLLVAACLAVGVGAAPAHDGAHRQGALPAGLAWDFTLSTLDGSRFVQASALSGPVLVNFWGKDCAPCITELPRLEAFARANPQWTVLLVSTDAPADAREFVRRHAVELPVLRPGANVAALMRSAGNRSGGLPFTVALRAETSEVRICGGQSGELAQADLARMAAACEAKSPP